MKESYKHHHLVYLIHLLLMDKKRIKKEIIYFKLRNPQNFAYFYLKEANQMNVMDIVF